MIECGFENFDTCVYWARTKYDQWFNEEIALQLQIHPKDEITSEGNHFWSGTKRCPHLLPFNVNDEVNELTLKVYQLLIIVSNIGFTPYWTR